MPQKITELQEQLETIIKGKKEITDKILMAVLAKGHVLLEDVPGVGKTTTALALSRLMGMDFNRIQFTPDVVPSDVTVLRCMTNRADSSFTVRVLSCAIFFLQMRSTVPPVRRSQHFWK